MDDAAWDDAASLRACAGGDGRALERLYARHAPSCLSLATRLLHDQALAEDAVQEAFLALWQSAATFDVDRCSVGGWVHTLVHRRAVDRIRRMERRPVVALDLLGDPGDPDQDPVGPAMTALMGRTAVGVLSGLPEAQRRAVVLAYWGGYTMSEIAVLEGVPLGTVKTRCRVALQRLRNAFAVEASVSS